MTDYFKSPVFQFKVVELVLSIVGIGFMIAYCLPSSNILLTQIVHFTLFGYFLLNAFILGGFLLREQVSKFLILLVNMSGAVFSLVSTVVLIVGWSQQDLSRLLMSAIATLLSTLVYAGDSYYIIRFEN